MLQAFLVLCRNVQAEASRWVNVTCTGPNPGFPGANLQLFVLHGLRNSRFVFPHRQTKRRPELFLSHWTLIVFIIISTDKRWRDTHLFYLLGQKKEEFYVETMRINCFYKLKLRESFRFNPLTNCFNWSIIVFFVCFSKLVSAPRRATCAQRRTINWSGQREQMFMPEWLKLLSLNWEHTNATSQFIKRNQEWSNWSQLR